MSQAFVNAFASRLATTGGGSLSAAVGGRIFHLQGESTDTGMSGVTTTAQFPYITFFIVANPQELAFNQSTNADALFQVDIWVEREAGSASAGTIEALLFSLMHNVSFTVSGYDRGISVCESRDIRSVEEDAIRSSSEYRVRATAF